MIHPSIYDFRILGRVIRITDAVIDYRLWLDSTFSAVRTRASSSLEELNDSQDEIELNQRLPKVYREHSQNYHSNGHYRHGANNINNNNNNYNQRYDKQGTNSLLKSCLILRCVEQFSPLRQKMKDFMKMITQIIIVPRIVTRAFPCRYAPSNGSGSWDSGKRSLSVYPSSGNGESCSSSRSSVASDKASWHDEEEEEDEESRSDIDPESSVSFKIYLLFIPH